MRHTSIVRSRHLALLKPLLWITLLAVKAMSFSAPTALSKGHVLVLDLTKEPPVSEPLGVPGMAVGGILGLGGPSLYPLPLDVKIQSVRPLSLSVGQTFVVEVLLRNQGATPFYLPAARDHSMAHRMGNKNRRCFTFMLRFLPPDQREESTNTMELTFGSETAPKSLLRLQPQESVLVRFEGNLSPVAQRISAGVRTLKIQADCSEYTLADDRFFIETRSVEVQSKNTIEITVQP